MKILSASGLRSLPIILSAAAACAATLRSQSPTNECCAAMPAEPIFMMSIQIGTPISQQFTVYTPPTLTPRYSTPMVESGIPGMTFAHDPVIDEAVTFLDAGRGGTLVSSYGSADRSIVMPPITTGLLGLATLYSSALVVDASLPAWTGADTHMKALTGEDLPVPYTAPGALAGEGFGLQPRPGNLPGQYIYQVGNDFYQYGGPLETGANPQTTAVYNDPDDGPAPSLVVLKNNLSGAQLWRFVSLGYIEVRHVDGTVARFDSFQPYNPAVWTPPSNTQLWRVTSVRDPYDNVASFDYNSINQLRSITFPSGMSQHFNWSGPGNQTPPLLVRLERRNARSRGGHLQVQRYDTYRSRRTDLGLGLRE